MDFVLQPLPDRENTSLCVGSEEMTSPRVENTASRVALSRGEAEGKSTPALCFRPEVRSFPRTYT